MAREAWKKQRNRDIKTSNNPSNPNQNACAYAVARHLGVNTSIKYLHRISDLHRAIRKKYTLRSRMSNAKKLLKKKPLTVNQFKKILQKNT